MDGFDTPEQRLLVYAAIVTAGIAYLVGGVWWTFSDVLALLTAVGTVGAIIVALWLGLQANRQQHDAAWRQCTLVAASLTADMESSVGRLDALCSAYGFHDLTLDLTQQQNWRRENYETVRSWEVCLSWGGWDIGPDRLRDLTMLPNFAAQRLQYGCRLATLLRQRIRREMEGWAGMTHEEQGVLLEAWYEDLRRINHFVRTSFHEIKEAAKVGAPLPTPEEMYGP